jgi:hypothetical protein
MYRTPRGVHVSVTTRIRVDALPAGELDAIRAAGRDAYGNALRAEEAPGVPLRCCLRPATEGEAVALISVSPFERRGPYAEVGPVFIHADSCPGYTETADYPQGYAAWPTMVFRPYHSDGRMAYAAITTADVTTADHVIDEIFGDPTIQVIHTRNVLAGCFMFAIHRAE